MVDERFNLKEQSGGLQEYDDNYIVERIDGLTGTVHFLNGLTLHEGDMSGAINEDVVRRQQIRETIKTHLERERQLFPKHIKGTFLVLYRPCGQLSSVRQRERAER